jgi:hypothetical protein
MQTEAQTSINETPRPARLSEEASTPRRRFPELLRTALIWLGSLLTPDSGAPDDLHKRSKVPVSIVDLRPMDTAKEVDAARLVSFEDAEVALATGKVNITGVAIPENVIILDFDKAIDAAYIPSATLHEFCDKFPATYLEPSQSRTGAHAVYEIDPSWKPAGKAKLIATINKDRGEKVELFFRGYVALTGNSGPEFREVHKLARNDFDALCAWISALGKPTTQQVKTDYVLRPKTKDLLALANPADHSNHVQELVCALMFDTRLDEDAADAIFRASAIYKNPESKWCPENENKWKREAPRCFEKAFGQVQPLIARMLEGKQPLKDASADSWSQEFPELGDWPELPELTPIVDDLLLSGGIHVFAGLFESYKTMASLELSSAILRQRPAFDFFNVRTKHEVLYLCPDMSPNLFVDYARQFGLNEKGLGFRVIRHDADALHSLDSSVLTRAVENRILFLDTMLDYADIKDAWKSDEWTKFFGKLRRLIRVNNCAAIVLLAHPTKAGARNTIIDPTEFLKDSVTFGGKIDVGLAFRKIDNTSKVLVQRIKGRGFKKHDFRFSITTLDEHGNSHLSQGRFPIVDRPDECKTLGEQLPQKKVGRKSTCSPEKLARIREYLKQGKVQREIAELMGVGQSQISNWLKNDVRKQDDIPF